VHVDEARGDQLAGGVDRVRGLGVDGADLDDATVLDADVGPDPCGPGPVDHVATLDQHIQHCGPPRGPGPIVGFRLGPRFAGSGYILP